MVFDDVISWLEQQKVLGVNPALLEQALVAQGWNETDIAFCMHMVFHQNHCLDMRAFLRATGRIVFLLFLTSFLFLAWMQGNLSGGIAVLACLLGISFCRTYSCQIPWLAYLTLVLLLLLPVVIHATSLVHIGSLLVISTLYLVVIPSDQRRKLSIETLILTSFLCLVIGFGVLTLLLLVLAKLLVLFDAMLPVFWFIIVTSLLSAFSLQQSGLLFERLLRRQHLLVIDRDTAFIRWMCRAPSSNALSSCSINPGRFFLWVFLLVVVSGLLALSIVSALMVPHVYSNYRHSIQSNIPPSYLFPYRDFVALHYPHAQSYQFQSIISLGQGDYAYIEPPSFPGILYHDCTSDLQCSGQPYVPGKPLKQQADLSFIVPSTQNSVGNFLVIQNDSRIFLYLLPYESLQVRLQRPFNEFLPSAIRGSAPANISARLWSEGARALLALDLPYPSPREATGLVFSSQFYYDIKSALDVLKVNLPELVTALRVKETILREYQWIQFQEQSGTPFYDNTTDLSSHIEQLRNVITSLDARESDDRRNCVIDASAYARWYQNLLLTPFEQLMFDLLRHTRLVPLELFSPDEIEATICSPANPTLLALQRAQTQSDTPLFTALRLKAIETETAKRELLYCSNASCRYWIGSLLRDSVLCDDYPVSERPFC